MDQDGSLNISFNEWRDFLLLAPSDNIHDIIKYWRHSTVSIKKNLMCKLLVYLSLSGNLNPSYPQIYLFLSKSLTRILKLSQ